jgi:hypothetical protein
VASLTLRFDLLRGAQTVHTVARGAIRGFYFCAPQHQHAMLADNVLLLLGRVTCAAESGHFVRRSNFIRRSSARGTAVLNARAVTGIATDSLLKVRMLLEVRDLLSVAGRAKFVRFLGTKRERRK